MRSPGMAILLVVVLSTFCQLSARGFEITEKSEPVVTLAQGSSGEIFCTSDEPYEFCKWSQVGKDKNCMVTSQNIEEVSIERPIFVPYH